MRHDYLLIVSHIGASTERLLKYLLSSESITVFPIPLTYQSPADLLILKRNCNHIKQSKISANIIFYNHNIQTLKLGDICKFIYLFDDPKTTMTKLVKDHGYMPNKALSHYAFRLQRLTQLSKTTKKSFLLINKQFNEKIAIALSEFLGIKSKMEIPNDIKEQEEKSAIGPIAEKAELVYNNYLARIENNLNRW